MYKYNDFDHAFVTSRNAQFREQVNRRISGALSEDEFKPLRLMNGLYLQLPPICCAWQFPMAR